MFWFHYSVAAPRNSCPLYNYALPLCCPVINFDACIFTRGRKSHHPLPSSLTIRLSYFTYYHYVYTRRYSSRCFYFLSTFFPFLFFFLCFPLLSLFVFSVREIIMELLPHGHVEILPGEGGGGGGRGWLAIYVSETQKPVCPLSSPKSIYTYTYYTCAHTILLLSGLPRGCRNNAVSKIIRKPIPVVKMRVNYSRLIFNVNLSRVRE